MSEYVGRESAPTYQRQYKDVELPNGKYRIQDLNNREKEELRLALLDESGKPDVKNAIVGQQARTLIAGWVDGEGNQVLSSADMSFVQDEMDPDTVEVMAGEIVEFAGINEDGIDRLKKRYSENQD